MRNLDTIADHYYVEAVSDPAEEDHKMWKLFFGFQGRINRLKRWMGSVSLLVAMMAVMIVSTGLP